MAPRRATQDSIHHRRATHTQPAHKKPRTKPDVRRRRSREVESAEYAAIKKATIKNNRKNNKTRCEDRKWVGLERTICRVVSAYQPLIGSIPGPAAAGVVYYRFCIVRQAPPPTLPHHNRPHDPLHPPPTAAASSFVRHSKPTTEATHSDNYSTAGARSAAGEAMI